MRSSLRISLGFASNHHHLSQVFGRLTRRSGESLPLFFSRGPCNASKLWTKSCGISSCGGGEIFGSPWTAECFGKCHEREKENPCRVVFLSQGVIKLRILWWSNDTNVWWIWGISLIRMHCMSWCHIMTPCVMDPFESQKGWWDHVQEASRTRNPLRILLYPPKSR